MVDENGHRFEILGFPTNQFGLEEPANNDEILNGISQVWSLVEATMETLSLEDRASQVGATGGVIRDQQQNGDIQTLPRA
ncbi:Hypp2426 [Branchiostoma lanceolatum]|uniref:Hypp2426 protein n=1 Tax=Branchiostoma lanceolatum TaxID=7740 RepID=A0A8J9ZQH9_BRALA|nr:Hypp2426 [Branchiostoma lanceolatum]